ncbi:DUF4124 domain-containing protein [Leucothrix pacifica]|uniref:DUF4124 domain-containing protein n=1 Tax=Leucothrix pacifica TaxID=1247513 RepID=UPI0015E84BC1|nr:DUF4124 domain-containing protein [Leucothrix pacifica]
MTLLLTSSVAQASLYRWVDENGKVHFSDKVPPSMAQKGHTSLNKNGVESQRVVSAEELKQKKQEEQKEVALEEEKTEAKLAEEEQKRQDDQLLATYENRDEIIAAYQKKLSLLDQSIGILSARDESLSQKLVRLSKQRKSTKEEMSRLTLSMQIENTHESLQEYRKAIKINQSDREIMLDQYRETLTRFDKLTRADR